MPDKNQILDQIKKTAIKNGGTPLGHRKFETVTGIRRTDWFGKYWVKWSEALVEAGLEPNEKNKGYGETNLLEILAHFTRRLGHYPVTGDYLMESRRNIGFPNESTFRKIGSKEMRIKKLLGFCQSKSEFNDVVGLLEMESTSEDNDLLVNQRTDTDGFVYLIKFGKYHKIGRTDEVGRRSKEIGIQLPEKTVLIHSIRTDDPSGIESYWHRRFADKRNNGEWFSLGIEDIRAFKKRRFM